MSLIREWSMKKKKALVRRGGFFWDWEVIEPWMFQIYFVRCEKIRHLGDDFYRFIWGHLYSEGKDKKYDIIQGNINNLKAESMKKGWAKFILKHYIELIIKNN